MSGDPGGRPALAMAVATALSRVTGLARTVALASVLGVTAVADAYNVANTIPTMIFTFVVGGIATSALVPLLVRSATTGGQVETAGRVLGATAVIGTLASIVLVVVAPVVVQALTIGAHGRTDSSAYRELATTWLRWCAPQVAFYAIGVAATSILQANRRLFLAAVAPVLTNLITIGSVVMFAVLVGGGVDSASVSSGAVAILGAGTTVAVGAATSVQVWGARRLHPSLRLTVALRHPEIIGLLPTAGWMVVYVAMNQIGLAVVVSIASARSGALSAYQWAFAVMQLPYALIAVSVLTAAYPELAASVHGATSPRSVVRRATLSMWVLLVPSAAGLWIFADPLAVLLVGSDGAELVASAARGFALSLVPFAAFQLLTRVSYARADTRTPALVNIAVNAANIGAALIAAWASTSASSLLFGLAVAHASSYIVGCMAMLWTLRPTDTVRVGDLVNGSGAGAIAALLGVVVVLTVQSLVARPSDRPGAIVTLVSGGGAGTLVVASAWAFLARRRPSASAPSRTQEGSDAIQ
ncbi:MAG: hypothetical protein OSA99_12505 [Acidimicrobiales bacterium]|nr:hypothetical protein [Acidimicrobiales bacterium]